MALQGMVYRFGSSSGIQLVVRRIVHTESSALHDHPVAAVPLYPPVLPSLTAKSKAARQRRREEIHKQIHAADSVQEKLRLLTRIQRLKYVVYPQTFALNADRWYQHFTKTAFLSGLPEYFTSSAVNDQAACPNDKFSCETSGVDVGEVRSLVCNAILQEHFYMKKRRPFLYKEHEHFVSPFLTNLVSSLTSILAKHNLLLKESSLDFNPQVNFYWLRGERTVPRGHRKRKVDPIRFQIDDRPHSQIRVPKQLPEFLPLEYPVSAEVPVISLEPDRLPLFQRQYDNNIFVGTKLTDPCIYGHTQFHLVSDKMQRSRLMKANLEDQIEVRLRAHGIASLFAWTGAQAMYQGFWSHADVARPFVSQCVITDGKYYSFFCYQLNTLALSVDTDHTNPRKNICWGTDSMQLYEAVEENDVKGFNDDALKLLIEFLLHRPKAL